MGLWKVLRGCCRWNSQARPALRTEGRAGFVLATTIRAKHNRLQSSELDFLTLSELHFRRREHGMQEWHVYEQ